MAEKTDSLAKGSIPSLLRKMAIPGVLSQLLLLLYNMVDRIYLGRLNDGGMALLAVGLCLPVTYFFNAVAFLFGQGGAARAMIRLGSGNREEAEKIMGNSVTAITVSGLIITVIFCMKAKPIMYDRTYPSQAVCCKDHSDRYGSTCNGTALADVALYCSVRHLFRYRFICS